MVAVTKERKSYPNKKLKQWQRCYGRFVEKKGKIRISFQKKGDPRRKKSSLK